MYFGESAINESLDYNLKHLFAHPEDLFINFKIHLHQNLVQSFKKHSYPGFLEYVNSRTKLHDVEYVKKDTITGIQMISKAADRIKKVESGQCTEKEMNVWGNNIQKMYIDKGVTSEDAQAYLKWLKETFIPACNAKIKELR